MATGIRQIEPQQNDFLAELENKSKRPSHFFRTMANRPEVLKAFVPLYGAIMGPGAVDRRTKELVYLTVSFSNQCAYCSATHLAATPKAGITEQEIAALRAEQDEVFAAPERAAIRYARELTRRATGGEAGAALSGHFSGEQIVEITLVAAMANFTNRFNNGLGVRPEQ